MDVSQIQSFDLDIEEAGKKRPETLDEAVIALASLLMASLRNTLIYSPTHSQFNRAITLTEKKAAQAFGFAREISFMCLEKEILFDGKPMNRYGVQFTKLGGFMHSLGIGKLTLIKGMTADELKIFILNMMGQDEKGRPAERRVIKASPHIHFGRLTTGAVGKIKLSHHTIVNLLASGAVTQEQVDDLKSSGAPGAGKRLEQLDAALLGRARDAVRTLASTSISERVSMQETLMNFINYFLKYSYVMEALWPLKNHDELSYKHSVNVALLCAAQARMLGAPEGLAKDIVVAGLLHDVGKCAIEPALLNKALPLSAEEKVLMAQHSLFGAQILIQNPKIPPIAVVAAYEHHVHYRGERGYPRQRRISHPHAVSQMVGLADAYDSLRTRKPYRPAHPIASALKLIQNRTGSQFDPFLVANFARVLQSFD